MNKKERESLILRAGIVILLFLLYVAFFVFPATDSIRQKTAQKAAGEKNAQELKKLLEENQKSGGPEEKKFEGSLSTFVEKKAKESDITISYIKPYGDSGQGVEIKVDELEGRKLIKFIYEMEISGVMVSRLNMRDYKGEGEWVIRMNLEI